MTDLEYVKHITKLYGEVLNLRKNDDYVVNQVQMDKFVEVLDFFMNAARKSNGNVEPIDLSPKEEHGGVTATFIVFDICGEDVQQYCKVMSYASAISIDGTEDGVCISVTIPNVFVPAKK